MLPTIDTIIPGVGGASALPRPEAEKPQEVYKTPPAEQPIARRDQQVAQTSDRHFSPRPKTEVFAPRTDQAEMNLQLTVEERDAFVAAFTHQQDPETMAPEERETLQKASERISKFIDDAIARNTDNRERVEKAVKEWYSRITKGEGQGPTDLIELLRQAAMGTLDDLAS